jgi:hypothetical protein
MRPVTALLGANAKLQILAPGCRHRGPTREPQQIDRRHVNLIAALVTDSRIVLGNTRQCEMKHCTALRVVGSPPVAPRLCHPAARSSGRVAREAAQGLSHLSIPAPPIPSTSAAKIAASFRHGLRSGTRWLRTAWDGTGTGSRRFRIAELEADGVGWESVSQRTLRWREMDSNPRSPAIGGEACRCDHDPGCLRERTFGSALVAT